MPTPVPTYVAGFRQWQALRRGREYGIDVEEIAPLGGRPGQALCQAPSNAHPNQQEEPSPDQINYLVRACFACA